MSNSLGQHTFQLTATDSYGGVTTELVNIFVYEGGTEPVAQPGLPQLITVLRTGFTSFSLDGSQSTTGGTKTQCAYELVSGPGAAVITNDDNPLTCIANINITEPGLYTFGLTFGDDTNRFDFKTVEITGDAAPVARAGEAVLIHAAPNASITIPLDGSQSSDAEDPPNLLVVHWASQEGQTITNPGNLVTSSTGVLVDSKKTLHYQLEVRDQNAGIDFDTFSVTVNPLPQGVISGAAVLYINEPESSIELDGSGSSDDVAIISFTWEATGGPPVARGSSSLSGDLQNFTGLVGGSTYNFSLIVRDPFGGESVATTQVYVRPQPVIDSQARVGVAVLPNNHTFTAAVTSPDGNPVTVQWTAVAWPTQDPGSAPTLSGATTLSMTASSFVPGSYTFRVTGTDTITGQTTTQDMKFFVNRPPVADASNTATTINWPNTSFVLDGTASYDPDMTAAELSKYLTYSWTVIDQPAAADGQTITSADNVVASFDDIKTGDYVFELTVTDELNLSVSTRFNVTADMSLAAKGKGDKTKVLKEKPGDPVLLTLSILTLVVLLIMLVIAIIAWRFKKEEEHRLHRKMTTFDVEAQHDGHKIMLLADLNDDDKIDMEEWCLMIKQLAGGQIDRTEMEECFHLLDEDKSGHLEIHELTEVMALLQAQLNSGGTAELVETKVDEAIADKQEAMQPTK
jgi:hypothetical protein